MSFKLFFISLVAIIGMATPAFAKGKKTADSADNNVSPDTEQIAEHDLNVYGPDYTDGDKFSGLTRKVGFDRMIPPHWRYVMRRRRTSSSRQKSLMSIWGTITLSPDLPTVQKTCCV